MAFETGDLPSDFEHPYRSDTEHDRRVRARLAELASERGTAASDVLEQLNSALLRGETLLTIAEEEEYVSGPAPRPRDGTTVVQRRPADEVWAVTSLEHEGPSVAQRSPCAGTERCPWRRDAAPGTFPAEAFRLSAPTSYPGSERRFGCHSSTPESPRVCAGWLLRGVSGNQTVQGLLASGALEEPVLPDGVELYDDYVEMAVANGVDEEDPALRPCQRPTADGADFVSFTDVFAADHTEKLE